MTDPLDILRVQTAKTTTQRRALRQRAAQTVDRLAPVRLAEDAINAVGDLMYDTGQQIRANPGTAAGVAAVAAIALFHRPLGRMADRWLDRISPPVDSAPPFIEDDGEDTDTDD